MSDMLEFNAYATIDMEIKRGVSVNIGTTFYNANGAEEDLTGWTARWMAKDRIGGDTWIDLDTDAGITISGGEVTIAMTPAQTRAIPGKRCKHDFLMRNSDGTEVICPFDGDITIVDVLSDEPPSA